MIIQCSIVATCSSGLVMQARYLTNGDTMAVKKVKACYDANLSLKDNALSVASLLQLANRQTLKQWQCNILECSETVFFTQDVTLNSVKF